MNEQGPTRQAETQGKDEKRQHVSDKSPTTECKNLRIRFVVPDVYFVSNAGLLIREGIGILYFSFLMPECLKGNNGRVGYPCSALSRPEFGFDICHCALCMQVFPEHEDAPEQFPDAMVGEEGSETGKNAGDKQRKNVGHFTVPVDSKPAAVHCCTTLWPTYLAS